MKDFEELCKELGIDQNNNEDIKKAFLKIHEELKSFKDEVIYVMNQVKNSKVRSRLSEEIKSTYDFIRYIK